MEHAPAALGHPALTVALALAAGIVAQAVARHLRLPGIVLLLATGVVLGPDVANLVRPDVLGGALITLVGFAVAVILFEGGLNLDLRRLRREQIAIRDLITLGAVVTAVGGTLAARLFLGWPWRMSILFGTLVIVTGPTVINPLLRRVKVIHKVGTVLEAEGVLIDAIGAIIAVVALEVALSPSGESLARGALAVVSRLGFGAVMGLAGGALLAVVLRLKGLVPEGLENVFTLGLVLALYQVASVIMPESGIAAVSVAGVVVGNARIVVHRDLLEFKEQLTVMLIGMLFVLLAADVRVAEVTALGWAGLAVVAALILVVRPLCVLAGTFRADLTVRQKLFIGWMGPRGIVAAAVASLFAEELARAGIPGGDALRALVFLVIAVTVVVAGLTGGLMARLLGVRRRQDTGWVILGANDVGRALAKALVDGGEEVVLVDSNPDAASAAETEGLKVIFGNGLEERTLHRAEIETRAGALGVTANEEVNLLFAQKAKAEGKVRRLGVALEHELEGVTRKMVHGLGAELLFAAALDLTQWASRLRRGAVATERWRLETPGPEAAPFGVKPREALVVPLVLRRGGKSAPVTDGQAPRVGDEVVLLVHAERRAAAHAALRDAGWAPVVPANGATALSPLTTPAT